MSLTEQSTELDTFDFFSKEFISYIDLETNETVQFFQLFSCTCLQLIKYGELGLMSLLPHCDGEFCLNVRR